MNRLACTLVGLCILDGCGSGGQEAQSPSAVSQCGAASEPASLSEHRALAPGMSGGANAWLEVKVSRAEPVLSDNHLLLDGREVAIARVRPLATGEHVVDALAGQLTPRQNRVHRESDDGYQIVGFRIPAGTSEGKRELTFKTCNVQAPETLTVEVLAGSAPVISAINVIRGAVWPSLIIKGSSFAGAEEVILVGADNAITSITNVTRVDDGIRVAVDKPGSYEVFVRTPNGVGGGPPNGAVTFR